MSVTADVRRGVGVGTDVDVGECGLGMGSRKSCGKGVGGEGTRGAVVNRGVVSCVLRMCRDW